jgi:hypothetical protein
MITGSCLCGATRFEIDGDLADATICHCGQCRRQTSHVYASTHIPEASLTLTNDSELRWFAASPAARRGFCSACGTVLFWNPVNEDRISVSMGALDEPHPGRIGMHIFTAHKGSYYDIEGTLPQRENF